MPPIYDARLEKAASRASERMNNREDKPTDEECAIFSFTEEEHNTSILFYSIQLNSEAACAEHDKGHIARAHGSQTVKTDYLPTYLPA